MSRENIPKKLREAVLDEYDHRCAVCAGDRPHLHHIDENASNNDIYNLLPLCPNCHLRDQHNPTRKVDILKLKLFRFYKDPAILMPQFHPIYTRQLFLEQVEINQQDTNDFEIWGKELSEFISSFEKGEFYGKRVSKLIEKKKIPSIFSFGSSDEENRKRRCESNLEYRTMLANNKNVIQSLIIEQLRYQSWANA